MSISILLRLQSDVDPATAFALPIVVLVLVAVVFFQLRQEPVPYPGKLVFHTGSNRDSNVDLLRIPLTRTQLVCQRLDLLPRYLIRHAGNRM